MSLYDKASLVMIPSGYKDDKLYSIKPTSGDGDFTFSRDGSGASPATRVNSAGLIEKGRTNFLLQSNSFDTTWTNFNSTDTSGQSGYDGTNDAWLLQITAASGSIRQNISSSGLQTLSLYAKAGTTDWVALYVATSGSIPYCFFDLTNGVKGATQNNVITSSITSIGGGWYRIQASFNITTTDVRIFPAEANAVLASQVGDNIYIQDAQLEKGLVATSVIETTTAAASAGILGDMPRLDYSGGASCPSLLLEPSRTNIHTNSEYLDAYVKSRATITSNAATSPEGVTNASKIIPLSTSNGWAGVNAPNYSFTSGDTYTLSVFAKAGEYNYCQVGGSTPAFPGSFATINLTNGVVEHQSGITATTEDYGNGWWRIYFTHTAIATAFSPIGFLAVYSTAVSSRLATQVGDDVSGIYAWGWMAEQASYPTSYIPTYGSATARAQDISSATGLSSTINSSEGVLYAELKWTEISLLIYLTLSDGTNSNRVIIYRTATNNVRMLVQVGGVTQASFIVTEDSNEYVKVAAKYKENDFAIWVNGTERGTATSGSTFSANTLNKIGFDAGLTGGFSGSVKQAIYFDSALTDAELAALTTI